LAHGLLQAVVLERDGHVAGERLEQPEVLLREAAVDALATRDGEQADAAGLPVQRGDHAGLHAARAEVLALAGVEEALDLDGPAQPGRDAAQALGEGLPRRLAHPGPAGPGAG